MSSRTKDRIVGFALLAAGLLLLVVYAESQLVHTLRFLAEWLAG